MAKTELSAQQQIEDLINGSNREKFLEKYIYSDAAIVETIINRYLRRLNGAKSVPTLGTGMGLVPLSPIAKPKTLKDAKVLADIILTK